MRARRLRHLVTLDSPNPTTDAAGGEIPGFTLHSVVHAAVEPIRGKERVASGQMVSEVDTMILIRWTPDVSGIDTTWRVQYDGVIYEIISAIDPFLKHREIELMCKSGVSQG